MNTSLNTIVIGSDLSALTAALVSVYHGMSTVLIREHALTPSFSENGYVFRSNIMPLGGVTPGGKLSRLLELLDLSLPDDDRILPPLQAILPDHRVTLFNDPDLLTKEIEREFGVSPKDVRNLYEKALKELEFFVSTKSEDGNLLGEKDTFQRLRRSLRELLWRKIIFPLSYRNLKKYHSLNDFIRCLSAALTNAEPVRPDPFSLPFSLLALSKGNRFNFTTLIERLVEKFESLGGHIVKDCEVETVSFGENVSVEVKIGDENFIIDGENIIVSVKWKKLSPLVLSEKKLSRLTKKYRKIESRFLYPFTFFLGVHGGALPEMMSEEVVVISGESQHYLKDNLFIIERSPRGDTSYAPEEKCALSVTMFLEDPPRHLNESVLRNLIDDSLESLREFLPFLKENIDFIATDQSIRLAREHHDVVSRKVLVTHTPSQDISFLSSGRRVNNLAITGGELLPAYGIDGEVTSGIEAAQWIIEKNVR